MVECFARRKRWKLPSLRKINPLCVLVCALIAQPCFASDVSHNFSPRRDLLEKVQKLRRDQIAQRIVQGKPAQAGRYPYVVSLRDPLTLGHLCGAVLIEKDIVLTAAHCVEDEPSPIVVIGATLRDYKKDKNAEVRVACRTIRHHQFERVEKGFDIALIVLDEKSTKKPIESLDFGSRSDRTGTRMTAIGWGRISENGPLAASLQEIVTLEYMTNKACGRVFEDPITATMLCANGRRVDTCQGDSGGPLIWTRKINGEVEDILMGLTSFGSAKCEGKFPGVYTRVSQFLKWVKDRGNPLLNIVDIGPATQCEGTGEEEEEPPKVPTGKEIMERILEDDMVGAAGLILIATEFGLIGKEELSKATATATKRCEFLELSKAFNLAIKDGKEKGKKGLSKMVQPFLSLLADAECDIPAPKAEEVLRKIDDGEKIEAKEDMVKLLKLGSRGRKVLEKIQEVSTEECTVAVFALLLIDAVDLLGLPEKDWDDVFTSLANAIDACEAPPPVVEPPPPRKPPAETPPKKKPPPTKPVIKLSTVKKPPPEPAPVKQPKRVVKAADLIESVEEDDDDAVDKVVELIENGEDVEEELEKTLSLAMEKDLGRDLGFVLITAAVDHPELEDILNPFLEELLERMSVADVAKELLDGDIEDTAVLVAEVSTDDEQFPSLASRKRIILEATEVALDEARKSPKTLNKNVERIGQILLEAVEMRQADIDVIDPAINVILVFVP